MRGISRIDSKHTHGWFVRVYREGKAIGKFFSDGVHGSREQALEVGRQYKLDYERENPPSPFQGRIRLKPQKNNKTGVLGISETYETWRNGRKVPCFSVSWRPAPNIAKNKRFYIHHFESKEAALEAAAQFRQERVKDLAKELNVNASDIPETPTIKKITTSTKTRRKASKTTVSTKKQSVNGKNIPETQTIQETLDPAPTKQKVAKNQAPANPMELMLSILKSKR